MDAISQNTVLYQKYVQLGRRDDLSAAQRKVIADGVRDFERAGVDRRVARVGVVGRESKFVAAIFGKA